MTLPLMSITKYNKDALIRYHGVRSSFPHRGNRINTHIGEMSHRSFQRLSLNLRNSSSLWKQSFCLTYHNNYPKTSKDVKRHLDTFLKFLRRKNLKYFWVLEFQKRGAVHYHLIIFNLPYMELSNMRLLWPFGHSHLVIVRNRATAVRYLIKYLSKKDKKKPKMTRVIADMIAEGKSYEDLLDNQDISPFMVLHSQQVQK